MTAPPEEFPRQLPLGFDVESGLAPDDLVVTESNAAAAHLVESWPEWPAPVVVLAGPAGAGKSHFAAAWRMKSGAMKLSAARIALLEPGERPSILIEDADRENLDETGLFHLINTVRASSGSLLLTARQPPSTWRVSLPDLASRLRAAALVEIFPPDEALLAAVIFKLFADRQIEIAPNVVDYLAQRMDRSLARAMELVQRLDALSLARRSRISRVLAAEALAQMEQESGRDD